MNRHTLFLAAMLTLSLCGCNISNANDTSFTTEETTRHTTSPTETTHIHDYQQTVVEPSCVDSGYTINTCMTCGESEICDYVDAIGHNYVANTVDPTYYDGGYATYICSKCGDSYKEYIVQLPYEKVNEIVYATTGVNVRKGPGTEYEKIGLLTAGESVTRIGIGNNNWSVVRYNNEIAYVYSDYLSTAYINMNGWPKVYSDDTCTITIYREWYENAYVYAAHLQFTDYTKFGTTCANGKYNNGVETTSNAAKRIGAIFAVNGDYAVPWNGASGYAIARSGVVCNDKKVYSEGIYNSNNGILAYRTYDGCAGKLLSDMVNQGKITDTFQFGPVFLLNGEIIGDPNSSSRAQRTFIGTNGQPGDIWVCVSDGRYNDGASSGLNGYQCGSYLKSKGCVLGIPLDGGGSSAMYFNGEILNAAKYGERAVVDFVYYMG